MEKSRQKRNTSNTVKQVPGNDYQDALSPWANTNHLRNTDTTATETHSQ